MSNALTHSNDKFYISTTPQNDDLTDHATVGFPGLTYTQVKLVGSIDERGVSTNIVSYDVYDRDVVLKAKGLTDGGSPTVELARLDTDPGQIALRAAGASANKNNYAFKLERQDGSVEYWRGLCAGPVLPGGRNEDFDLHVFTIGLQQAPLEIAAP